MSDDREVFWRKAEQNLLAAESEFSNQRYDSCVTRCYYACFQVAIAELLRLGIRQRGTKEQWRHEFVHGEFVGQLVNRRKLYSGLESDTLARLLMLRQMADYEPREVSRTQADRAVRHARLFLAAVRDAQTQGGESR